MDKNKAIQINNKNGSFTPKDLYTNLTIYSGNRERSIPLM